MKKILLIILLVLLTGCGNQEINVGAEDIKVKLDNAELLKKMDSAPKIKEKYKLEKSAFIKEAKTDDDLRVEIGDKTKDEFVPEMTIGKWGEISMKIKVTQNNIARSKRELLGAIDDTSLILDEEKITYTETGIDYVFYDIEPNEKHPKGAYEFEIVLQEYPGVDYIEIDIETDGLDFYYQPELTQEEIDEGANRLENVIGSYAIYHDTKTNHALYEIDKNDYSEEELVMNSLSGYFVKKIDEKTLEATYYENGINYKAGKFSHMYKPEIEDANSDKYWGSYNEDLNETKKLRIYLPEGMVYPIIIDPIFGYDTIGGTQKSPALVDDFIWTAHPHTGAEGTLASVSLYTRKYSAGSDFSLAVYDNSDNTIVDYTVEGVLPDSASWVTLNVVGSASISTIDYALAWWTESDSRVNNWYDTISSFYLGYDSETYDYSWPTTLSYGSKNYVSNIKYSIYATYTVAGGADTCSDFGSGHWEVQDTCFIDSYTQHDGTINCSDGGQIIVESGGVLVAEEVNRACIQLKTGGEWGIRDLP